MTCRQWHEAQQMETERQTHSVQTISNRTEIAMLLICRDTPGNYNGYHTLALSIQEAGGEIDQQH